MLRHYANKSTASKRISIDLLAEPVTEKGMAAPKPHPLQLGAALVSSLENRAFTRQCHHCDGSGRETDPVALGAHMRKQRLALRLSLREVASRMDFSAPFISDLEHGRRNWTASTTKLYREALTK